MANLRANVKRSALGMLEIGRVYRTPSLRYLLAVGDHAAVSGYNGELVDHPNLDTHDLTLIDISIGQLGKLWGVGLDFFDAISKKYLYPHLPAQSAKKDSKKAATPLASLLYRVVR